MGDFGDLEEVTPIPGYRERAGEAAGSLEFGKDIVYRLLSGQTVSLEGLAEELDVDEEIIRGKLEAAREQIENYARMESGIATGSLTKVVKNSGNKVE